MDKPKKRRLTIYRVKDSRNNFANLEPTTDAPSYELESEGVVGQLEQYKLFIQRGKRKQPNWYGLLAPVVNQDSPILNSSSSFVLFLTQGDQSYVLTGGYGHHKVQHLIDEEFGLNIALRVMDKSKIQSVLQKPMKGQTRQIFRVVAGYDPGLDMGNYNRILKSIEGISVDADLPDVKVSGQASLSLNVDTKFEDLPSLLGSLSAILKKDPKINFPKSYEVVDSETLQAKLDEELINELNSFLAGKSSRDSLYVEFNDPLTQFQCTEFTIEIGSKVTEDFTEFSLDTIAVILKTHEVYEFATVDDLVGIKFSGKDDSGNVLFERQSLKQMLVCEVDTGASSYIYIDRKWLKILDDLKEYVDEQLSRIPVNNSFFPDWSLSTYALEKLYNEHVAKLRKIDCLDQDLVYAPSVTSLELCDLYDQGSNNFIHVKRTWGSKSSYLFAQGLVSASAMHQYKDFRDACIKKWPGIFKNGFDKKARVTFAVAHENISVADFPNNLSFFAKLNLVTTSNSITAFGYDVALATINVV